MQYWELSGIRVEPFDVSRRWHLPGLKCPACGFTWNRMGRAVPSARIGGIRCVAPVSARVKATGKARTGKAIGRPRRDVDLDLVHQLRAQGRSWRSIAQALKVPVRTLRRSWQNPTPGKAA